MKTPPHPLQSSNPPPPDPRSTSIESKEELLAELEELGPVLVTAPDGSRWLYLTSQKH